MRQIKFRGKRNDQDEWVFGDLIEENGGDTYIVQANIIQWKQFEVDPDTVSQFTGLTDKNGTEIYEGDVVQYEKVRIDWSKTIRTIEKFEIEYNDCANYNQDEASKLEIIGNIHDNPSLLTKK